MSSGQITFWSPHIYFIKLMNRKYSVSSAINNQTRKTGDQERSARWGRMALKIQHSQPGVQSFAWNLKISARTNWVDIHLLFHKSLWEKLIKSLFVKFCEDVSSSNGQLSESIHWVGRGRLGRQHVLVLHHNRHRVLLVQVLKLQDEFVLLLLQILWLVLLLFASS